MATTAGQSARDLYTWLETNCATLEVSKLLPALVLLAKKVGDAELEHWAKLEADGFTPANSACQDGDFPEAYRTVPGTYFNEYGQEIVFEGVEDQKVTMHRLRFGAAQIEEIAKRSGTTNIRDTNFAWISERLGTKIVGYVFQNTLAIAVLHSIRSQIIDKFTSLELPGDHADASAALPPGIAGLHPIVQQIAGGLYRDGYYYQAILSAYIRLVEEVKTQSGRHDLDGSGLMTTVFSANSPTIKLSDVKDEQTGYMWLFQGAVMGIRNANAHRVKEHTDPQQTLEWLTFASALFRVLDDAAAMATSATGEASSPAQPPPS